MSPPDICNCEMERWLAVHERWAAGPFRSQVISGGKKIPCKILVLALLL
jgi:hypothetical protein